MLLVTNRPSVYVVIKGKTVELEVDVPTEVSDYQGAKLIKRQICMAVVDDEPELLEGETGEVMEEVLEVIEPTPESASESGKKSGKKK